MLRRFLFCLLPLVTLLSHSWGQDQPDRDPSYAELRDFLPVTAPRHVPPSQAKRYILEIGYADLREKPPGKEFMMESLPMKVTNEAVLSRVPAMQSYRASRTLINLVDKDPDGKPLESPFALGEVVHYTVTSDNEEGISFTYYYYYCEDVKWFPTASGQSWDYELKKQEHFRNLTLRPGMWYIIAGPERNVTTVERSETVTYPVYTYYLVRIKHGG